MANTFLRRQALPLAARRPGRVHRRARAASAAAAPGEPLVVLGDLDAPAFTDGYVDVAGTIAGAPAAAATVSTSTADLVEPNLEDALADVPAASRYTSTARGSAQQLHHVLVNAAAADLQSRAFIAHANADFPAAWQNDASRAERAASTDAVVVYFEVASSSAPEPPPTTTTPRRSPTWSACGCGRGVPSGVTARWPTRSSRSPTSTGQTLNGPFVLGVHPAGRAVVLNANGKSPRCRGAVWWAKKLRPRQSFHAWCAERHAALGHAEGARVRRAREVRGGRPAGGPPLVLRWTPESRGTVRPSAGTSWRSG